MVYLRNIQPYCLSRNLPYQKRSFLQQKTKPSVVSQTIKGTEYSSDKLLGKQRFKHNFSMVPVYTVPEFSKQTINAVQRFKSLPEKESTINAGGKEYDNDMIKGGPETVKMNLEKFWQFWQAQQRDKNLYEPAIKEYEELIENEGGIDAPFCDSIDIGSDGLEIRTSEGRHRLHAAHNKKLLYINILKPSESALQMVELGGLAGELFPDL